MLKDFKLIHRRKPHMFSPETAPLVWETCLRSISFSTEPEKVTLQDNDELYVQHHAFEFLLEIICGLHSPILGETEVFGQFKIFAKEWQRQQPGRASLIQKLFTDAKEIRSRFLCGLGTQSYGGWLKRNLTDRQVHIIGGGQLAQEIAPYLVKASEKLTLHVRTPAKVDVQGAMVKALSERAFTGGAVVIAAPVRAEELAQWLGVFQPSEIFDLRAESVIDPVTVACGKMQVLNDIFCEIEQTKTRLLPIIDQVKCEISARGIRLAAQTMVRPQGWDDICA